MYVCMSCLSRRTNSETLEDVYFRVEASPKGPLQCRGCISRAFNSFSGFAKRLGAGSGRSLVLQMMSLDSMSHSRHIS
jgi:hypothetical protein